MEERMDMNGAPCAGERALEAAAVAAPAREKQYVKPTMQVFPLGCGLLAASASAEPPVRVILNAIGVDYYWIPTQQHQGFRLDGGYWLDGGTGVAVQVWLATSFSCDNHLPRVTFTANKKDNTFSCARITPLYSNTFCGDAVWDAISAGDYGLSDDPISFEDEEYGDEVGWDAADFFANAEFDECEDGSRFSGTYQGRRFVSE